jgi:hypothetical protein
MNDVEGARAQAEAMNEQPGRALRSARRSQMWAGLNRYLASEAAHARRTEEIEDEEKGKSDEAALKVPRQKSPPRAQDRE